MGFQLVTKNSRQKVTGNVNKVFDWPTVEKRMPAEWLYRQGSASILPIQSELRQFLPQT